MDGDHAATASAVLQVLADLSATTEEHPTEKTIPTEWFRWLALDNVRLFWPRPEWSEEQETITWRKALLGTREPPDLQGVAIDRDFAERLAAVERIRWDLRPLRVGWLFVAGRTKGPDGEIHRVFHPLVTIPVRVARLPALGEAHLAAAGDAEVSELVSDPAKRHDFEGRIEFGGGAFDAVRDVDAANWMLPTLDRLKVFAHDVAGAAGFTTRKELVGATKSPDALMNRDGLVVVAGIAVYALDEVSQASRVTPLRAWAAKRLHETTAFHSMYLDVDDPTDSPPPDATAVESPFPLTPVQRRAVAASRTEPVTLISGAPGTGKSHTIAAIACDALAHGDRVLVAAKSDATVDALLDLLDRAPGPDPVVFGSTERRVLLAERLSGGQFGAVGDDEVSKSRAAADSAFARRDELRDEIRVALAAELVLEQANAGISGHRSGAPGFFIPTADLDAADALADLALSPRRGWGARRRSRRAVKTLRRLAQCSALLGAKELRDALEAARSLRVARDVEIGGGLVLEARWRQLEAADDEARDSLGRWLECDCRSSDRLNRSTLPTIAALATALRSGRSARRQQLGRLNDDKLTRALPLWAGTLGDIDDLLPPVPALFDLVILDEASSIDQPLAAAALLRGRRAVVAGDPRQLRQVSFVSDAQLRTAVEAHGFAADPVLAARLDVRRNSAFDVAAGVAPVLMLDEHFRSYPHLFDFVARELYDGKVNVATRSPATESVVCVDVVRTSGHRDKSGVVSAEIDWVLTELKDLLRSREGSTVGVVTPFRAQADAMEEAVLASFTADDIEALDLRVGTVHAFQGNERDVIIASFALGPEEGANSWRFVEDPHLFAVFMTRARRHLTVLLSADPPAGGLAAAYLAQANAAPGPPKPAGRVGAWADAIADDLVQGGVPTIRAYPTGRHVLDICIDDERGCVALECGVHADGPDAHIERHLALARGGWRLIDAYRSRWGERRGELVVSLIGELPSALGHTP